MDRPPQSHREGEVFAVVPVAGRGKRRGAWLAAGGFVIALVALVSVGALNRVSPPPQGAAPSPRATTAAGVTPVSSVTPAPSGSVASATAGVDEDESKVTTLRQAGYEVAYQTDATHRPIVFDHGALAVFNFGDPTLSGTYEGTIHVSVGTPAKSAAVLSHSGLAEVFGETLDALEASYLSTGPGQIVARETAELDGEPLVALEIEGGPAGVRIAALAVHGRRAFVITATGFDHTYPGPAAAAARLGLRHFLAGFVFGTSLFVSDELGFQVPLPVAAKPFGTALSKPLAEAIGLYVFPDGLRAGDDVWTHSIGVSVGSKANPGLVRVLPSRTAAPDPRRIWAASLVELQAAYLAAIDGPVGSSSTIQLDDELALIIEHPDGLGRAVLAVHHGRDYIISTSGLQGPQSAPDFEAFLAGFAFLD